LEDYSNQKSRYSELTLRGRPELSAYGWGGFAEYVSVPEKALALKPANLTFEEAGAVPQAAVVALQGLRNEGQIQPGHKVLINGASGGIGTFAVQIAKSFGAEVIGVCSSRNLDMVRSIGADQVIDYMQEDFTNNGNLCLCRRFHGCSYQSINEQERENKEPVSRTKPKRFGCHERTH